MIPFGGDSEMSADVAKMIEEAHQSGAISPGLAERGRWSLLVEAQNLDAFDTVCSFMDLGGFGHRLRTCDWDLDRAQKTGLLGDLAYFYKMGAEAIPSPTLEERVLVLNDGIARTVDLAHPIDMLAFLVYVRDLVNMHARIVYSLRQRDLSVRTVLAGGERIQYAPHSETAGTSPVVYNPFHFQMNTAFSRAYLIEKAGSAKKVNPDRIYVDAHWVEVVRAVFGDERVLRKSNSRSRWFFLRSKGCGGCLRFSIDGRPLLDLAYDSTIRLSLPEIGAPATVLQLSEMREHRALDGDESSMPLKPDHVIQEYARRKDRGWPKRPA